MSRSIPPIPRYVPQVPVSLADGLRLEETLQRALIGGPNQMEAVQANMQKRAPRFKDPQEH